MPDIVVKWLTLVGVAIALVGVGFVKGCQHGEAEAEKEKAKAIALAATEKARISLEHAQTLSKYQEKEKTDEKARADLAAANAGLRNAIAGYRRNPPIAITSENVCEAGKLLGVCAERYESVALRGAELVSECSGRLESMAGLAESERGKAELAGSLYNSIRNRSPK